MSSARRSGWIPWALFALVVVAWTGALYYDQFSDGVTEVLDRLWLTSLLAFPMVGAFLASRIPSNPVGWLFILGPGLFATTVMLDEMGQALDDPALVATAGPIGDLGLLLLLSSVLLFPTGRYPSSWWRAVHVLLIIGLVVEPWISPDTDVFLALNLALSVVGLIYRLIVGDATTRRQIAGPVLVLLFGMASLAIISFLLPPGSAGQEILGTAAVMMLTIGIPVSIAVAVLRYRLYEIDRIVSRTLSYTVVIGLLAVVFFGVVTVLTSLLPTESDLAVAGSTLAVAALFNPLRRRVQAWVDRRFNRSRYDAQKVMDAFSGSLRDRVDPDGVVDGWVGAVSETMQPSTVAVWVREAGA
ncbi:MAG: hypothetical protein WEE53_13935 [Acidimicrobiia bacterium]